MDQTPQQPLVSIQCLVYNHEPYLRQCLDGFVMQQTDFKFEAIVHDDASTDRSADIIREYAEKYPDIIKPILQKVNQYSKGRGTVTRIINSACNGKYIAVCEGDDFWTDPYRLQKYVTVMEGNKNIQIVYSNFNTVDKDGAFIYREWYEIFKKKSKSGDIFPELLLGNFILTVTCMYRRVLRESNLFQKCPAILDYSLFLSAAAIGDAYFLHETTANYRLNPTSLTQIDNQGINLKLRIIRAYFIKMYLLGKVKKLTPESRKKVMMVVRDVLLFDKKVFLTVLFSKGRIKS